jgi:hypothetical protein
MGGVGADAARRGAGRSPRRHPGSNAGALPSRTRASTRGSCRASGACCCPVTDPSRRCGRRSRPRTRRRTVMSDTARGVSGSRRSLPGLAGSGRSRAFGADRRLEDLSAPDATDRQGEGSLFQLLAAPPPSLPEPRSQASSVVPGPASRRRWARRLGSEAVDPCPPPTTSSAPATLDVGRRGVELVLVSPTSSSKGPRASSSPGAGPQGLNDHDVHVLGDEQAAWHRRAASSTEDAMGRTMGARLVVPGRRAPSAPAP